MSESVHAALDRAGRLEAQGDREGAINVLHDALNALAVEIADSEQRWAGFGGVFDAAYAAKVEFDALRTQQQAVYSALGELCRRAGRAAEAEDAFRLAEQLQTDTDESRALAAHARARLRKPEPADSAALEDPVEWIQSAIQSVLSSLAEELTGEAKHELRLLLDWVKGAPLPERVRRWILAVLEDCRTILVMKGSLGVADVEEGLRWISFDLGKRRADGALAGVDREKERQWLLRIRHVRVNPGRDDSPLHRAVGCGDEAEVRRLLESGAVVNEPGAGRNTPLHIAAGASAAHHRPHTRAGTIAMLLLGHGADVHAMNGEGETPLHCAAGAGNIDALGLLLGHGAEVNAGALDGATPLHGAAGGSRARDRSLRGSYEPVVRVLLERGADVNARSANGGTALHRAAEGGHEEVVRLLLSCGADINAEEQSAVYKRTALHWAARSRNDALVRLLLDRGADIENGAGTGRAPLHEAALTGQDAVVGLLFERGANIHAADPEGRTALHLAALNGHGGTVGLLLQWGARPTAVDHRGKTALDLAREWSRTAVVALLERT